jgi:mono/diheme cytochrome c family protein
MQSAVVESIIEEGGFMIFKKTLRIVLSASALIAAASSSAWSGDASTGKAIYDKQCASCHGADGKGNPAMIKALGDKGMNITTKEVKAMKDEQIIKIIVEGAGKMPPSKNLSAQEQKELVSFTRSLAK